MDKENNEYLDFHAERLVFSAANIIMGYLLVLNADRDKEYKSIAEIFIKKMKTENREKSLYIKEINVEDLNLQKIYSIQN